MIPKNHRLVLEIVRESGVGCHRSTSEIFSEVARRRPGIGATTIYRALARLRDLGLVREVLLPHGNAATYEPMGPDHAHFHCTSCGNIEDVQYRMPNATLRRIATRNGVAIVSENVTFEGLCSTCR